MCVGFQEQIAVGGFYKGETFEEFKRKQGVSKGEKAENYNGFLFCDERKSDKADGILIKMLLALGKEKKPPVKDESEFTGTDPKSVKLREELDETLLALITISNANCDIEKVDKIFGAIPGANAALGKWKNEQMLAKEREEEEKENINEYKAKEKSKYPKITPTPYRSLEKTMKMMSQLSEMMNPDFQESIKAGGFYKGESFEEFKRRTKEGLESNHKTTESLKNDNKINMNLAELRNEKKILESESKAAQSLRDECVYKLRNNIYIEKSPLVKDYEYYCARVIELDKKINQLKEKIKPLEEVEEERYQMSLRARERDRFGIDTRTEAEKRRWEDRDIMYE